MRPAPRKAGVCEGATERLAGQSLDVAVHVDPVRAAQRRRRAPGGLERLALLGDIDNVVLVEFERGEEGGGDRGHDEVEVGGGGEGGGQTQSREGRRELEQSGVELQRRLQVR